MGAETRKKHETVKLHSQSLIERKRGIAEYQLMRAHYNYRKKMESEREMIESYNVNMNKECRICLEKWRRWKGWIRFSSRGRLVVISSNRCFLLLRGIIDYMFFVFF
jgi:hypothetical protein